MKSQFTFLQVLKVFDVPSHNRKLHPWGKNLSVQIQKEKTKISQKVKIYTNDSSWKIFGWRNFFGLGDTDSGY